MAINRSRKQHLPTTPVFPATVTRHTRRPYNPHNPANRFPDYTLTYTPQKRKPICRIPTLLLLT
ncbi:hypothetical protein E3A20_07220, partial [Planctomyces bekefii]